MDNNLDSWDNFTSGNFLKADLVKSDNDTFVAINIETIKIDEETKLRLTLEKDKIEYDFDLNKTNAYKLKELGVKSPREVLGKKIYFKKALVRNPKTNKEVDSLRIYKVE